MGHFHPLGGALQVPPLGTRARENEPVTYSQTSWVWPGAFLIRGQKPNASGHWEEVGPYLILPCSQNLLGPLVPPELWGLGQVT